jgi:octaprenyl-diphosphate synthase
MTMPEDAMTTATHAPPTAGFSSVPSALRPHPFDPILTDLDESDRIFASALAGQRSPVAPLIQHLKHYRGKRLRPALVFLTAQACGGIRPEHHILAAATEMIHTATLVHDDVLDEAEVRRHVPTFNAEWGNKIAILLGDMLFTQAFHLTSRVDVRACNWIGEATNRVCAGELRQVCERGNLFLSEADYYMIVEGKTAALTEVCGRLGATYARAPESVATRMAEYGRCLGMAFQIADDLLDLTGDPSRVGKTLGTDLEQGKLTLPLIHALNVLPEPAATVFRDRLRTGEGASEIVERLASTGSLGYAKRRAEELAAEARNMLNGLPRTEAREILEQLTDWSIRRER